SSRPGMSAYGSSPGAATTPAGTAVERADDAALRLRQVPPGARAAPTSTPGQARVSRRHRMQCGEGAPVEGPSVHARRAYGGTAPGWWMGSESFPDPPEHGMVARSARVTEKAGGVASSAIRPSPPVEVGCSTWNILGR